MKPVKKLKEREKITCELNHSHMAGRGLPQAGHSCGLKRTLKEDQHLHL